MTLVPAWQRGFSIRADSESLGRIKSLSQVSLPGLRVPATTGGRYLLRAKGHPALDGPASGWRGRNESPLAPYFGHGAGVWNPDQRPETRTPHGPDGGPLRRLGPRATMRGIIALFDGRTLSGRATACRTESRRFVALRSWLSLLFVVCIASGTRCAGLHAPASPVPSGCRSVYREWSG